MDKRLVIAVVLAIVLMIGFYFFAAAPPVTEDHDTEDHDVVVEPFVVAPRVPAPAPLPPPDVVGAERTVAVYTDLFRAVFTSIGGTIKSIELKEFRDAEGAPVVLKGDDLLPPLVIGTDKRFHLGRLNFSVRLVNLHLWHGKPTANIVFTYTGEGFSIQRTFTFHYDRYGFELTDKVIGLGSYWITLGKDFGIFERDEAGHLGPVILADGKRVTVDKILAEPRHFTEGIQWIAQEDKYFFSAIVPITPAEKATIWSKGDNTFVALKMEGGENSFFIYAGPKEYEVLKAFGFGLERIIDFGFFAILAVPMLWVLKQIYSIFPNYGVAIILLTLLIRIPFIPLINNSIKSMQGLRDIQPKVNEIKERNKKNPQRMQKEIMELYKKHKINPFGGCLPMLIQVPFFLALYKVLSIAIELRKAPFIFWLTDLSEKDPFFILPILMGAAMVIQQKMTPSAMEPMQQKMMMLMPVVFTIILMKFPSGLVLYWLVNTLLGIVQQLYMEKKPPTIQAKK